MEIDNDAARGDRDINEVLGERWEECLQRITDELYEFELFRVRETDPQSTLLADVAEILSDSQADDGACVEQIVSLLRDNGYEIDR